jgi:hypothetical protein
VSVILRPILTRLSVGIAIVGNDIYGSQLLLRKQR